MSIPRRAERPARIARRIVLGLLLLCSPGLATTNPPPALHRVIDILNIPADELARRPAVMLRGTVSHSDSQYQLLFLQDATAGVFLYRLPPAEYKAGDFLEVRGTAAPARFAPMVQVTNAVLLFRTNLPPAREVSLSEILSGSLDSQRVRTRGMVQRQEQSGAYLMLELVAGLNRCKVWVRHQSGSNAPAWIDSEVEIEGIVAAAFRQKDLTGFQLFANSVSNISVVRPPPADAFTSPVLAARDLNSHIARRQGGHRVRVQGIVTLHWPGSTLVIEDNSGGIEVEPRGAIETRVGDRIEAVGFPSADLSPRLQNATLRILEKNGGPPLKPEPLGSSLDNHRQRLIVFDAAVAHLTAVDDRTTVLVQRSNDFIAVAFPPGLARGKFAASLTPGARVRFGGVLKLPPAESLAPPTLLVRDAADVVLLRKPGMTLAARWAWTGAAAFMAALMALALVMRRWMQQRAVLVQVTSQEAAARKRSEEMELLLRRSMTERERISQDLHDNIIQSLYAVGLGLDEARRALPRTPEKIEERLKVSVQALNTVIRDVRSFIGGSERRTLDGPELKTALKSVLVTAGTDQEARFAIRVDPMAAHNLTPVQATELFNVAKEAMTNSLRHANARVTTVSVVPNQNGVRLEVVDDGIGFEPEAPAVAGLGMRNMMSRARNIGGELQILSEPGKGTKVILDVPFTLQRN